MCIHIYTSITKNDMLATYMYVCIYIYRDRYMYIYIYMYTYTHTHASTLPRGARRGSSLSPPTSSIV